MRDREASSRSKVTPELGLEFEFEIASSCLSAEFDKA